MTKLVVAFRNFANATKNRIPGSQKTLSQKYLPLMDIIAVYRKTIVVYCENHVKRVNKRCGGNEVYLMLTQLVHTVTSVLETLRGSYTCIP
jgi:hypothetical protein